MPAHIPQLMEKKQIVYYHVICWMEMNVFVNLHSEFQLSVFVLAMLIAHN